MRDQQFFADLSGDINPMHLDPLSARRTQAGAPVVHGVHALLWAIDALSSSVGLRPIRRASARFEKFIYLDREIDAFLVAEAADRLELELRDAGMRILAATIELGERPRGIGYEPTETVQSSALEPQHLDLTELPDRRAAFALRQTDERAASAFPNAADALSVSATNALVGLSTLVGMHCPGRDSIFAKLSIEVVDEPQLGAPSLSYNVRRVNTAFRQAAIDCRAAGLTGTVEAFLRHAPHRGPAATELRHAVGRDDFLGDKVLIVGGSRGLGELVAKLLAAGGAETVITYSTGAADAEAVAAELRATGAQASTLRLDVEMNVATQIPWGNYGFSHIYYFATPQIFAQSRGVYSASLLRRFMRFYVDAFAELVACDCHAENARFFYPSSVAIDTRPSGTLEYVIAKMAGELLCEDLNKAYPQTKILVERLPRLQTDQTATVMPVESADSLTVMLGVVRHMHAGAH